MALLEYEKDSIRRHLGYPTIGLYSTAGGGGSLADGAASYRYWTPYGLLEWRMCRLKPDEESRITGSPYGAVGFAASGVQPNPGDVINVTFTGGGLSSPQTITVTVSPGDDYLTLCSQISNGVNFNSALMAAGFVSVAIYGTGPYSRSMEPLPISSFRCPLPFNISVSFSGQTAIQVVANGINLAPYLNSGTKANPVMIWGYLPILDYLESVWLGSSSNQDTLQAGEWKWNSREAEQRKRLYDMHRGRLGTFLSIPVDTDNPSKIWYRSVSI